MPEQPGIGILRRLLDYLRDRKILLVLDNCEHLLQACAKLANTLLSNTSTLKIMATSREGLGVTGELIWHVPSLSLPDVKLSSTIEQFSQYEAVQLFIERARLVQPHFVVTNDNAPAVAQICLRLDGIPLAIELAAARVRALNVYDIAKRLDDCFRLLTGGSRTALERHQTLRATIAWSYNLLSAEERLLLCRLSIFSGGWTIEAAEKVCMKEGNDLDVLELLTHLVDKSLVILDGSRYRMLETTRQYAQETLVASEEVKALCNHHLAYFLELAEQADRALHGPDESKWKDRLELENENFRAALEWCVSEENTEAALRLLSIWARAQQHNYHFREMHSWFNKLRALPETTAHAALYARLLNYIGGSSWYRGDYQYAKSVIEESQTIWLKLGVDGELGLAEAWTWLGDIALSIQDDVETAQFLFEQSAELYQKHGNEWGIGRVMFSLGRKALFEEHYVEAEEHFKKSLAKWKELGYHFGVAHAINELGVVAHLQGDYERAGKFYEQGLKISRELQIGVSLGISLFNLAWVALDGGDFRNAKVLFDQCLELFKQDGEQQGILGCLAGFASILGMSGRPETAAGLFGAFECLREAVETRMDLLDQKEINHYMAIVRAQLDEATFERASTEGCTMTMEQAVTFALEQSDE